MCGIAGVLGTAPRGAVDVRAGVGSFRHRGPDLVSVLEVTNGIFGQALLSIIGDRHVEQPMVSTDDSSAITFNDEIYNFIEFRAADGDIAAVTSGRSDSEVVLVGLARYGLDFVPNRNGMFAFASTDSDGVGYLVRDRIGIKPLCYEEHPSSGNRRRMGFPIPPTFYGSNVSSPMDCYETWLKFNIAQSMLRMHG